MFGYVGTKSFIGDARPMEVVRAVCANRGHVRPPAIGKHTGCLPCLLDLRDGRGRRGVERFRICRPLRNHSAAWPYVVDIDGVPGGASTDLPQFYGIATDAILAQLNGFWQSASPSQT